MGAMCNIIWRALATTAAQLRDLNTVCQMRDNLYSFQICIFNKEPLYLFIELQTLRKNISLLFSTLFFYIFRTVRRVRQDITISVCLC